MGINHVEMLQAQMINHKMRPMLARTILNGTLHQFNYFREFDLLVY